MDEKQSPAPLPGEVVDAAKILKHVVYSGGSGMVKEIRTILAALAAKEAECEEARRTNETLRDLLSGEREASMEYKERSAEDTARAEAAEAECEALREEAVCLSYKRSDFICELWPRMDKYEADHADYIHLKSRAEAAEGKLAAANADARRWEQEEELEYNRAEAAEAWKARVMAWAKGRCASCEYSSRRAEDPQCDECLLTSEKKNWTPPTQWEGKQHGRTYNQPDLPCLDLCCNRCAFSDRYCRPDAQGVIAMSRRPPVMYLDGGMKPGEATVKSADQIIADLRAKLTSAEARVEALEGAKQALKGTSVALKYLMDALDIDPEETRININSASGVVASVTFAELCSRADAALAAANGFEVAL